MYYKSFEHLSTDIRTNLHILPNNISLVVGIPRSGLLAANLISLFLNCPLTDLDSFLKGSIISSGERGEELDKNAFKGTILIVDDSIHSGKALNKAKEKLKAIESLHLDIKFCAVYALPGTETLVDYYLELVQDPRVFEWNIFHHKVLNKACVDIDGVLCVDPTESENDDGDCYINFLSTAKKRFLPKVKIETLVTSRLEKYRMHTEEWLRKNDIEYGELVMLNLPDKASRMKLGNHATFKAEEYKKRPEALLFIESSKWQAEQIFKLTGKDVYCVDTNEMVSKKDIKSYVEKIKLTREYTTLKNRIKNVLNKTPLNLIFRNI